MTLPDWTDFAFYAAAVLYFLVVTAVVVSFAVYVDVTVARWMGVPI